MTYESSYLDAVRQAIIDGDREAAVAESRAAIEGGVDALLILREGLTKGADIVGQYFEAGKYFLPQLMLTGRALKAATEVVVPFIKEQHPDAQHEGISVVVMATIQTDVHDIGKNLVASMLSASGFTVHDLGVDVAIDTIIDKAIEVDADIIGCSALLTTSAPYLRDLIATLDARSQRDRFKVMVGGASVTPELADAIGSDGTAPDAVRAVKLARSLMAERQEGRDRVKR